MEFAQPCLLSLRMNSLSLFCVSLMFSLSLERGASRIYSARPIRNCLFVEQVLEKHARDCFVALDLGIIGAAARGPDRSGEDFHAVDEV